MRPEFGDFHGKEKTDGGGGEGSESAKHSDNKAMTEAENIVQAIWSLCSSCGQNHDGGGDAVTPLGGIRKNCAIRQIAHLEADMASSKLIFFASTAKSVGDFWLR